MKKILAILILGFAVLFAGRAKWNVEGYDKDFQSKAYRQVVFNYTGQSIDLSGMKTVTANQDDLHITYTGVDSVRSNVTYYGVEPIPIWGDTIVWVRIDTRLDLEVTE